MNDKSEPKLEFKPEDIQGNILRGYRRSLVRHLILKVDKRDDARRFLAAAVEGKSDDVPAITRESRSKWPEKPAACFNLGMTYEGLKALGTPEKDLKTFPTEFSDGMTKRALKLGDFDDSAPANWPAPFDKPMDVHVIASIHADEESHLDRVQRQVERAFKVLGVRDGRSLPDNKVFFDYRDNISQPRFKEVSDPSRPRDDEPVDPLGTVLLGYPTRFEGLRFAVPEPKKTLGNNGTFNAFRVLAQDVAGFEAYLDRAAGELLTHPDLDQLLVPSNQWWIAEGLDKCGALREVVAAQMCGRWRNGVPYATSPDTPLPDPPPPPPDSDPRLTNFDYTRSSRCPAGAHTRRCNPRGGPIVQRIASHTRRLVRRGMSYGPDFDPENPDDGEERGLLGNFIGANLGAQFEAVMCDWLNVGLQNPDITGASDPLLGANASETSWFDLTLKNGGTIRLRGFPRFVTTRGGAYTFLPSLPAIEYLSRMTG